MSSPKEAMEPFAEAQGALQAEREVLTAEIKALQDFQERASEIRTGSNSATHSTSQASGPTSFVSAPLDISSDKKDPRAQIQAAYRETVMAVPFADELEDNVREHMMAELGSDIADAVFNQSGPPPNIVPILHGRIKDAIQTRRQFLKYCRAEADTLDGFYNKLEKIHSKVNAYRSTESETLDELVIRDEQLVNVVRTLDQIAQRRQQDLHTDLGPDVQRYRSLEYLYRDCSFNFPVLVTIAIIGQEIKAARREIAYNVSTY